MINNRYFNIYIESPFRTWWKAKKLFKIPKTKIHIQVRKLFPKKVHTQFGDYVDSGMEFSPYANINICGKILDVYIHDIIWKDKWDTPRHERNPLIWICLFKSFSITIMPVIEYLGELGTKENGDTYYWEFLLTYLYYKHDLKSALLTSGGWHTDSKLWKQVISHGKEEDGSGDKYEPYSLIIPTQLFSLNKRGLKQLQEND